MTNSFQEGDLVEVTRKNDYTISIIQGSFPPMIREIPAGKFEVKLASDDPKHKSFLQTLEGKVGLVVYVERNRLAQCLGYRVLFEGKEVFIKSKVAEKYLKLVENQNDAGGRSSKIQTT